MLVQRRLDVNNVETTSKQRRMLTGHCKGRFPLGVFLLADEKTKEKKLAERKKS